MKLTVQVEADAVEAARQRAARKIAKQTKIPGFRPGKAPYSVVMRTVGEAAIFEEAVEILANDLYPKVIEEAQIEPYGPGQLENIPSMEPLTLEFMVPLEAEVTLTEYHSLRLPYDAPVIGDEDVQRVLNDLRERQAVITPVERAAKEGDQVSVKLSGERIKVKEGENPILVEERSTTINIKKASDKPGDEWPFPGFSRKLVGLSAGDEKTVTYTYPKDSDWDSLRGEKAQFRILVESVKSRELPKANDEFAQSVGEYQTIDDLTKDIHASLEEQSLNEYNSDYNQHLVEELVKEATIKYPPQMLEHEVELYIDQLENRLAQQGLDLETYLKARQMDQEALHAEVKPLAEQRLKHTLAIFKVAREENIRISNEEVEQESSRALAEMSRYMTQEQAKKAISEGYIRNLVGNISTDLLIRRTYERLQAIARDEYHPEEQAVTSEQAEGEKTDNEIPEAVESPLPAAKESEQTEQAASIDADTSVDVDASIDADASKDA